MARVIEAELAAQNETTPEFQYVARANLGMPARSGGYIQFLRGATAGGAATTFNIEVAIPQADGTVTWTELLAADLSLPAAANSTLVSHRTDLESGCHYRVIYTSTGTDAVTVLVAGAYLGTVE